MATGRGGGRGLAIVAAGLAALAFAPCAHAQAPHPGETLYQAACATCHDRPDQTRAPTKATLQAMSAQTLAFALTAGKMQAQGAGLNDATRGQLISYLTGKPFGATEAAAAAWSRPLACPALQAKARTAPRATISTFGFDARNTRSLTRAQAGLAKADLARLDLAWSLGFPSVTMMRAQPAVVGDTIFLPVAEASSLYAIDISDPSTPCLKWAYKTADGAPLRTSAAYGVIADGRQVLAFSGQDTTVHVVDAATGKAIWTKKVGAFPTSLTTGTPRVLKDRIIVPVSQFEIMVAGSNSVTCCTNHGFVLSLDPRTGAQQWRYDTMEDAKPQRDRGDGKMLWGPSGAPIWNSPVVDEKRGLIYFGTGESNSPPAHRNTDALIAVRLADGHEAWSMQATARDIFNVGCGPKPRADQYNCVSDTVYRDVDFGASLILGRLADGRELLFAGQKSGSMWALEPGTGKVVWRRDLGTGSPNGGIHWGIAFDGRSIYAPIAEVGRQLPGGAPVDGSITSGLYALDAATGAVRWNYEAKPDCTGGRDTRLPRCQRLYGFSAAPTVVDGAILVGGLDGMVRALDARDGSELWRYDTARAFDTANGVKAKGGSIDAASIVAADGLVLVGSGYGMFGQAPGNALLAFRPRSPSAAVGARPGR